MINEKQLSMFEGIAYDCCFLDLQKIILELVAEVRRNNILEERLKALKQEFNRQTEHLVQTRREADWLAKYLAKTKIFHPAENAMDCPKLEGPAPEISCITCWREAARKAVEND